MESGYAEVNSTRIYYEIAGNGTPILLIHGNFGDRRHWDDQFAAFSARHRVIRYDVRGFGKSSVPIEGEQYAHHQDAAALLLHLGVEAAHIVGVSMGAGIATDFVLEHPKMSLSLVSVGPWVVGYQSPAAEELFGAFKQVGSAFLQNGSSTALEEFLSQMLKGCILNPQVREKLRELGEDYSFWHFSHVDPGETQVSAATAGTARVAAERLTEIVTPCLIVTSDHDYAACQEIADLLEQTVDHATKAVFADTGHLINMERPERFNRIVLEFIDKSDGIKVPNCP